jgi:anionic cell wall polymer biosynthesis LytR-Cps2A-Psr (LCP) family protein
VYKKGNARLNGWQALDYVRQRYPKNGVPDADYGRQRHQQQFIKAMVNEAFSADVVTNPVKLDRVLRAAGQSLIFNGRGNSVVDFALALKNLRSESIVMIKLPGGPVPSTTGYKGERLLSPAEDFFAALRNEQIDAFMLEHPEFKQKSS